MTTYTVFTVGKYNADILKFTIEADTLQKAEKKAKRYMNGDPLGLICGIIDSTFSHELKEKMRS